MESMHGSLTNTTAQSLRLNCDCRFQVASKRMNLQQSPHGLVDKTKLPPEVRMSGPSKTPEQAKRDWGLPPAPPAPRL